MGHMLSIGFALQVREHSAPGISTYLHETMIARTQIQGRPTNLTHYARDGEVVEHVMARVARS